MSRVLKGSKGWLFLDGDTNNVISQHKHGIKLSVEKIEHYRSEHSYRRTFFNNKKIKYIPFVVPDKHSVYREYLPWESLDSINRVIGQIQKVTKSEYVYPLDYFESNKSSDILYGKSDTHWTDFGAYIGYQYLSEMYPLLFNKCNLCLSGFKKTKIVGDLGNKFNNPIAGDWIESNHEEIEINGYNNNNILYTGNYISIKSNSGRNEKLLIFGNSFSSFFFLKLFLDSFKEVVFLFSNSIDYKLVEREKPTVVLHQMSERFLVNPARDFIDLSARERAGLFLINKKRIISNNSFDNRMFPERLYLEAIIDILKGKRKIGSSKYKISCMQDDYNSYDFCWSMVLYLTGKKKESFSIIINLDELYPKYSYLTKFLSFLNNYGDKIDVYNFCQKSGLFTRN